MSNLFPTASLDPVYQIETTDQVIAGPGGIANRQAQSLLNRTEYILGQLGSFATTTDVTNAIAALSASLAASGGSAGIGFLQQGTGSVSRTAQSKMRERVSVKDFGAVGDGVSDDTTAFATGISVLVILGGGILYAPQGTYLLNGTAGLDGLSNGILIPDTNGNFNDISGIIIQGDGINTVLRAGSTNMIVVRSSRLHSGCRDLKITGAGLSGTWCAGVVPESTTQTTEQVSNSFQVWSNVWMESSDEGMVVQPGPTVLGSDSGCFYHEIQYSSNLCHRALWLKTDVTGANNRATRSKFDVIALRYNTGIQVDRASECSFKLFAEMGNIGTTPNAVPIAALVNHPQCVNLEFIGYSEVATRGLELDSTAAPYTDISRWNQTTPRHSSLAFATDHSLGKMVVSKLPTGAAYVAFGYNGFVDFTADPSGSNTKTLNLNINASPLWQWDSARKTTMFGSLGNIEFDANGANITFTRNGTTTLSNSAASGGLRLQAKNLEHLGDAHTFYPYAGGTPWADILANGFDHRGQNLRLRTSRTPASATAAGNAGEICWDSGFIYVCTATNTWKRVAIAAW